MREPRFKISGSESVKKEHGPFNWREHVPESVKALEQQRTTNTDTDSMFEEAEMQLDTVQELAAQAGIDFVEMARKKSEDIDLLEAESMISESEAAHRRGTITPIQLLISWGYGEHILTKEEYWGLSRMYKA